MASETQQVEAQDNQAPALIADGSTPTIYGVTLNELIADNARVNDEAQAKLRTAENSIQDLTATIEGKNTEIEILMNRLKNAALRTMSSTAAGSVEKLPDGSLRLVFTIPSEAGIPYASQAEDAGVDLFEYVTEQLKEAILAYSAS